ncbi:MAG: PAS domain S-box protein [Desulfamplus sp.]|nr:PAS domain S-box protein [Desulfamplus sp.]
MIYGKNDDVNHYLLKAVETIKRQIVVISPDYRILASNCHPDSAYFLNRNSTEGDICHQVLFNLKHPCPNCPAAEVNRTGKPAIKDVMIYEDGQEGMGKAVRTSCLYAYPMPALKGEDEQDAIVVLDFDLPSLFKYDEQRSTSNAFLRNLINSAADGVIAADMTGKIIIFNKAATRISGYSREEAIESLNIRELYPPGDAKKIMKKMRSSGFGGKGMVRAHRQVAIRKDGSTIPITLNASIVYEGDREVASIGFFYDLTESKRLEAELEKMQIQLLQAEKMSSLGKLAAGVAHQLNNPLGGITLFTQLILEEHELHDDLKNDIMRIQKDAERCSAIVKELLEFARQTRREAKLQNINKIVGRTLFLLRNQSIFQNIKIIENYDTSLPEIPVDVQQINHVFMNIILNAADAMEGSGTLEIKTSLDSDGDMALITIADSGPGIPESIISNIFEPFFTTKEEGKGTGLGLSMAYGIMESHKGKISVENRSDGGAVFSISLPLKKGETA